MKKAFQGFLYSNLRGHFWLLKAHGLGCVSLTPQVLHFQKTFFRNITFDWDFESIVSDLQYFELL